MERNFPIKPTEGKGSKSAERKKGNEPACQKGTTNFAPAGPTNLSGLLPELVLNIPDGPNQNGPFHFMSDRKFRN